MCSRAFLTERTWILLGTSFSSLLLQIVNRSFFSFFFFFLCQSSILQVYIYKLTAWLLLWNWGKNIHLNLNWKPKDAFTSKKWSEGLCHIPKPKKINKNANTMDNVPLPRLSARSRDLSDAVRWSGLPSARFLVQSQVSVPCHLSEGVLFRHGLASCHHPLFRGDPRGLYHCDEYPYDHRLRLGSLAHERLLFFSLLRSSAPHPGT